MNSVRIALHDCNEISPAKNIEVNSHNGKNIGLQYVLLVF